MSGQYHDRSPSGGEPASAARGRALLAGGTAEAIAASVERAIATGALGPGERLPSVRALAAELGVSPATVSGALASLRRRGLVVSRPRSGTRVAPRPPLSGARRPVALPAGVRDLASGNPDPALLPDLRPVLRALDPPVRLYGAAPVLDELAVAAMADLAADGIPAARLAVVNGALDGIERVLEARLAPGDAVAVEDPGWANVFDVVRALGLRALPVAVDGRGMVPGALAGALRGGARAVVLTPRGHNPTGAALDAQRAGALRSVLATSPDVLVLEDDHLGPVAGASWEGVGPRHRPGQESGHGRAAPHEANRAAPHETSRGAPHETSRAAPRERGPGNAAWAVVRSASKWLGPDLRAAVLAGDELTLSRVEGRQSLGPGWVSGLSQAVAGRLWRDPEVVAGCRRAAEAYARRRAALVDALAAHGLEAVAPSGINVWVPVPDEDAAVRTLLADGWAVAAGAPFRLDSPPAVRITTAALAEADAPRVAAALARAVRPARRTRAA